MSFQWKDGDGNITKEEVWDFYGEFDRTGFLRVDSEKIEGWGQVLESADSGNNGIVFYGTYKTNKEATTYDLIKVRSSVANPLCLSAGPSIFSSTSFIP